MIVEFGMGTSLRRLDYTEAARRAIKNALWRNSLNLAELFEQPKEAMIIDVEIGVQDPDAVDTAALCALFPYGQPSVTARHGGLDIAKPHGPGRTIIANCALTVSLDLEAPA